MGIAYGFQNPPQIAGVKLKKLICRICPKYLDGSTSPGLMDSSCAIKDELYDEFNRLGIGNLASRNVHEGFSGGEMKRSELFQVLFMHPKIMLLDEPNSSIDYDSLKILGRELKMISDRGDTTMVIISHSRYVLEFLNVNQVYILKNGHLGYTGNMSVIPILEEMGYEKFLTEVEA
jgi:Fe-S cluster assembly ATP-binding protein